MDWQTSTILITGGTGSFGRAFVERVMAAHRPKKLIVFSRDEYKQYEMRKRYSTAEYKNIRYFIGDVRDRERLYRAFDGVDVVVHAAALKQVPAMEYNPIEAVKTNILGAAHLIDAAIDRNVKKVIALSTDKAVNPINLYGATKLCAEKLFVQANHYAGLAHGTRFAVARYGNVVGSRGSVIPFFVERRRTGTVPITDERMTRFWITLPQSVDFVLRSLERMSGGEIFVPKIPSARITDIAQAVAPECRREVIGIRPGEKLHELLVSPDDAMTTVECADHFVVFTQHDEYHTQKWQDAIERYCREHQGRRCPPGYQYGSDTNPSWIPEDEIKKLADGGGGA